MRDGRGLSRRFEPDGEIFTVWLGDAAGASKIALCEPCAASVCDRSDFAEWQGVSFKVITSEGEFFANTGSVSIEVIFGKTVLSGEAIFGGPQVVRRPVSEIDPRV